MSREWRLESLKLFWETFAVVARYFYSGISQTDHIPAEFYSWCRAVVWLVDSALTSQQYAHSSAPTSTSHPPHSHQRIRTNDSTSRTWPVAETYGIIDGYKTILMFKSWNTKFRAWLSFWTSNLLSTNISFDVNYYVNSRYYASCSQ